MIARLWRWLFGVPLVVTSPYACQRCQGWNSPDASVSDRDLLYCNHCGHIYPVRLP